MYRHQEKRMREHTISKLEEGKTYNISLNVKISDEICKESNLKNRRKNKCTLNTITKISSTKCEPIQGPNEEVIQGDIENVNPFREIK